MAFSSVDSNMRFVRRLIRWALLTILTLHLLACSWEMVKSSEAASPFETLVAEVL